MAVASEERIYAQVGTLDPTSHQLQHQPNQIFYNAQFDIDTMGKVPRKQIQPGQSNVYYPSVKKKFFIKKNNQAWMMNHFPINWFLILLKEYITFLTVHAVHI